MRPRYTNDDNTGPIAIMQIYSTDGINPPGEIISRYRAKVLTGPGSIKTRDCLVNPRLRSDDIEEGMKLVVRLNMPVKVNTAYRGFHFGNSVTSKIPDDFDYAEAREALIWGTWKEKMDGPSRPGVDYFPTMVDVNRAYDIGDMFRIYFIRDIHGNAKPISYHLFGERQYEHIRIDPVFALSEYISVMRLDKNVWDSSPMVMLMDEIFESVLDMQELLNPSRLGIKHCIRMDLPFRSQARK